VTRRPFGLWESPITPGSLARGTRLSSLSWDTDGRTLGWLEGRSGAGVPVVLTAGEVAPREMAAGISVRAQVGYGGGDLTLARGDLYFVGQADQRIYRQPLSGGGLPRPITPPIGAASSPALSPNGRWVVYVHTFEDQDCIAVVDAEGRSWPAKLASGRDFYMQPSWAPSGSRLTWVEWDHPNMPWDGTEVMVAELAFPEGGMPRIASVRTIAGGRDIAAQQPTFTPDGSSVLYLSDDSGWGQLYKRDHVSLREDLVTGGDGDFGGPAWPQGRRVFAVSRSGATVTGRRATSLRWRPSTRRSARSSPRRRATRSPPLRTEQRSRRGSSYWTLPSTTRSRRFGGADRTRMSRLRRFPNRRR
jgi:hypothetical protein